MASRYMTEDKTLWILVNSDFSGAAIVGYRLDDRENPIAEHESTYQWSVPGDELLSGCIGESEIDDERGCFWHVPFAHKVSATGYHDGVHYGVPEHVVGRAVALANRVVATNKIVAFGQTLTW